ncbi:MAG: ABC transporter permease [Armatimonadetes bacterium CG07_land_8_20_14_0_80_40_9]|nr:MAG: ABC transporter permease [Armatimonadetes bacterium CG07_land_8_20_14_0_80_40_9]
MFKKKKKIGHLPFILPAIIFILSLTLYPVLYAFYLSFTDASLLYPTKSFVGVRNYTDLLSSPIFFAIMQNTFIFVFSCVFLQFTLGLGLALALNQKLRGRVLVRVLLLISWVIPGIIIGLIFQWMFIGDRYGLINYCLISLGVKPVEWLSHPLSAMLSLIAANTWRGTAFSMIIQLAALQTIPDEQYEAANVDGASSLQKFYYITLPWLKPTILINIIMITLATFNTFDLVMSLTGGGPVRATEVISLYMYKEGFAFFKLGSASALAMIMFLVNIVFTLIYIRVLRQDQEVSLV